MLMNPSHDGSGAADNLGNWLPALRGLSGRCKRFELV